MKIYSKTLHIMTINFFGLGGRFRGLCGLHSAHFTNLDVQLSYSKLYTKLQLSRSIHQGLALVNNLCSFLLSLPPLLWVKLTPPPLLEGFNMGKQIGFLFLIIWRACVPNFTKKYSKISRKGFFAEN